MAMSLCFFPGYKDGDEPLSQVVADNYVAGMPLGLFEDGLGRTLAGANVAGMALSERIQDSQNGKAGYAPKGSKAVLSASLSPSLDKLIIAKGISAGAANFGDSNNKLFARGMTVDTSNPAYQVMDPTDLGVTKVFPYDPAAAGGYVAGMPLYVDNTTGQFTTTSANSDAVKVGIVVKLSGENLTVIV